MKYTSVKIMLAAWLACSAGAALAADTGAAAVEQEILRQNEQVQQEAARAEALDLDTVQTQWERCDVYEYYQRMSVSGSRRGKKQVLKDCERVSTRCAAVYKDGNFFVPANCFYAERKSKQRLHWQHTRLVQTGGRMSLLRVVQKVKDFVVLAR